MKKSLSLLLAFALVFSMFSSLAFAANGQSAAQKLVNAGIIKGSASGDLMENETWKRQDVTVIISRLLGVEEEAQNTAKNHSFADVTDPYYDGFITYAYENGYFNGHSEIRFGYGEEITVKQFVAVMLRVLGYDVAWDEVEEVAVEVGLVPAGTDFDAAATRGEYFTIIDTTLQTETADGEILGESLGLEGYAPEAPEVAVQPVGAKKIQVAFNKAMNKDQVKLTVKKGNNTTNINKITWSDDNKTATIETAAKLTKGQYTVTVSGAAESDYVLTFEAEDERVANVEITNDKAPMVDTDAKAINLFFKATNQYGENVTRANEFTVMVSKGSIVNAPNNKVSASNGKLTAQLDPSGTLTYSLNEQIIFTVTYADIKGNFATDQKTLTVSAPAKVSSVNFTELYNKDGKELTTATNLNNDAFYILIEAKDQYGNNVTAAQLNNDTMVANLGSHLIAVDEFETINDGVKEDVIGLKLDTPADGLRAGTARITVYSTAANANSSFDVEVVQASRLETLSISSPDVIPVGERVEIPFEAYDQNGNAIESYTKLVDGLTQDNSGNYFNVSGANATLKFEHDPDTNKAKLILDTTAANEITQATPIVISATTVSQKFVNATLTLSPRAKAVSVVKVEKVTGAVAKSGGTTKLETQNIYVEDQYGRTKKADFFAASGFGYSVTVTGNVYNRLAVEHATPDTNGNIAIELDDTTTSSELQGLTATGLTTLTLALKDSNGDAVPNSDYKLRIRTVSKADIESYTVEVEGDVYYAPTATDRTTYAQKIKVTGKMADGTTVAVPAAESNEYMTIKPSNNGLKIDGDKIQVDDTTATPLTFADNEKEKTYALTFIGETKKGAQPSVVEVKVSTIAPAPASFELKKSGTTLGSRKSDNVLNIRRAVLNANSLVDIVNDVVLVKDQYGKEISGASFVSASVLSYSNTNNKAISDVRVGESIRVIAFTQNAKQYEFTINVNQP